MLPTAIRPRPWVIERILMEEAVTLLLAAGSSGKSSVSLAVAAHLAMGLDFAGYKTVKPRKSIIYNGEDDIEEQSRRLLAICMAYEFDYEVVKQNIMLLSQKQFRMDLVLQQYRQPVRNEVVVSNLIKEAMDPNVGLVILDPLVKIHKVDESDNVQMDYVMETLTDIASTAKVSVMALHHTSKGGDQDARVGNMDISRGASAIVNASRIAFTLVNASNQDVADYGLQADDRRSWVRLDDAKMNLTLAKDQATWFKKEGVRIPSLDVIGVLKHEHLNKSGEHMKMRLGRHIKAIFDEIGKGMTPIEKIVQLLKAREPLIANLRDIEIKKKLEGYFGVATEIDGGTIEFVREGKEGKQAVYMKYT